MRRSKSSWNFSDDTEDLDIFDRNEITRISCSYNDDHNVIIYPITCGLCKKEMKKEIDWDSYDDIDRTYFCSTECLKTYGNYKRKTV
tara:strand:- start:2729 stop:2989 length:261 start_codon:yes stop_codon:yes gene_type:complete